MDPASAADVDWAVIARLGRTRGLKGEIYGAGSWPAERYAALPALWVRNAGSGELRKLTPASVRPYKGSLVFRFEGVDSIEAAEPLERLEVVVPKRHRPPLEVNEVYLADLIGCELVHRHTGARLGAVTGWREFGGPLLLEVEVEGKPGGEPLWIPFARAICVEIDPVGRRIVVDPPEGLLELNEPESGA